jgi:4-hydroxy-tetrahydrodipicolinate synthase
MRSSRPAVLTASLTPLDQALNIDGNHLARHVQWLLKRGASGVVLMGTTGEANSFSTSERMTALEAVLDSGVDSGKLVIGTGCCALTDTVDLTKNALLAGVHRILVLPPFYYKQVDEDGLFAAYDLLLQSVGSDEIRIYLYHFPKMSAVPISVALVERLIQVYPDSIAGFKDSSGDWAHISAMIRHFRELDVFAGSEQFLLDTLRAGGAGCISATANVSSQLAAELLHRWENPEAKILQTRLYDIRRTVEQWPMIPALKALMKELTHQGNWANLRPPLNALAPREESACVQAYRAVSGDNHCESGY